jgi:peptide/nickel transport system permease protein
VLIYIARRLVWMVVVVAIVLLITFAVFFLMPAGDPALRFAGKSPTPESLALIRHDLGLDQQWYEQFGRFVKNFVTGDEYGWPGLGYSYNGNVPVREEITTRAPRTLWLILGASIIWLVCGVAIGVVSAIKRRSVFDRLAMGFALFGISAPVFWLGLMALFIFWKQLHLTGGTGYVPLTDSVSGFFSHMILPWCVLALLYMAIYARLTRNNLLETLGEDYIRTARAKGLEERGVVLRHGLRNAFIPTLTMIGLSFGWSMGGSVLVETVYDWPGIGLYATKSALTLDFMPIMGIALLYGFVFSLINLAVDLTYAMLDPRISHA